MVKKVVIIGPESTGKSTLCEMLAQHFNTLWCPEFAREYLLTNGSKYDFDGIFPRHILKMAQEARLSPALVRKEALRLIQGIKDLVTNTPYCSTILSRAEQLEQRFQSENNGQNKIK